MTQGIDIHLFSAAGHNNYGDDLITEMWLEKLRNAKAKISLYCGGAFKPDAAYKNLSGIHNFWNGVEKIPSMTGDKDLVILTGGGYSNVLFDVSPRLFRAIARAPANSVIWTGADIFPQSDETMALLENCRSSFRFVETRDKTSCDLFNRAGIKARCGVDDIFMFPKSRIAEVFPSENRNLILNVQNQFVDSASLNDVTKMIEHRFASEGFDRIVSYELCRDSDSDIAEILLKKGLPVSIVTRDMIGNRSLRIPSKSKYITTRFHFHLAMCRIGAEGTCISLNEYYDNKHRAVIEHFPKAKRSIVWSTKANETISSYRNFPWIPSFRDGNLMKRKRGMVAETIEGFL